MTRSRLTGSVALAATTLMAAALSCGAPCAGASPAPTAVSPDQPKPRLGTYRVTSRGDSMIHARCLEGGHVFVSIRKAATPAQRDRALHDACKSVDYTK
jgi:hypothetical protein